MPSIRITLLSDGSSDAALLPIINWSVRQHAPEREVQAEWADLRRLPRPPQGLSERIKSALQLYPCDLLCVHRDAENQSARLRYEEIEQAVNGVRAFVEIVPHVCVVPVRMQEAWLLIDEDAIREASGNPNGQMPLKLPAIRTIESVADPKALLYDLIREASELNARRRKRMPVTSHAYRVASIIEDFSALRRLIAFQTFEADLQRALVQL